MTLWPAIGQDRVALEVPFSPIDHVSTMHKHYD